VTDPIHIPVLRFGREYDSLERKPVKALRDGQQLASVSQANAGLIRRDFKKSKAAFDALQAIPTHSLLEICSEAGRCFMEDELVFNEAGDTQSPEDYVNLLSASSGLPHNMVRGNMKKINTVFTGMAGILKGLTRGLDLDVLDKGIGEHSGVPVSYAPAAHSLGVVLPSNSPGVNSIWMPSIALGVPVVLKPGRDEPWTPMRIARAFIAAGCPPEAFSFYPTDHEGAGVILDNCDSSQLFGDAKTTAKWAQDARVELHGPGWSKLIIGEDEIDNWESHLDVLVSSVLDNGGRSCINASAIFVPRHAEAIADAIAKRIAPVAPVAASDPEAKLSAFANPAFAEYIDSAIEAGLKKGGAEDVTARYRGGPRATEHEGARYLRPTIIHCQSIEHELANTEFLFPFASVVEVPQAEVLDRIGHSLVVTGITKDDAFQAALVASRDIDRLNIGPVPTSHVDWDQPHEGNLFEALYQRRAIRRSDDW
jgi:acyl-CoA reductase-like NAD-dependent aldehyde dehydrogenase